MENQYGIISKGHPATEYAMLWDLLNGIGYGGYINTEQEPGPHHADGIIQDLTANRDCQRRAGF